jgi:hypothetical protein
MVRLHGRDVGRHDVMRRIGREDQVGGVRLVTVSDGRERGVRVLEVRTGPMSFDILVDRAFDIGRCDAAGVPVAWTSPVGVIGPWYAETTPWGWLRGFGGGLMATCGLDHAQGPGEDRLPHAYAVEIPNEEYPLHGRIGAIPARLAGYGSTWSGDECILWAEGEVTQASLYGERLVLRRRIEADLGGTQIRVRDRVENVGMVPWPHMLLYHCNIGWPIVDEGAELVVPAAHVREIHDDSPGDYRRIGPPEPMGVERVYEQELDRSQGDMVSVAVINRRRSLAFVQHFDARALPIHNLWRMLAEGFYVLGLEPATNRDSGRWDARDRGELQILEPGEVRAYALDLAILQGAGAIDGLESR